MSAVGLIAALTLASRVLGLVRECLFGYFFATSELLSAFRIAFMIPNLARRLFGEGALSAAAIPVLTTAIRDTGEEPSRRFVGSLLTLVAVVLVLLVGAIELLLWIGRTVHDDVALRLTMLLMPYMALICLTAIGGAVLHVRQRFAAPALAPVILNLGIILSLVGGGVWAGLHDRTLMHAVCAGVLIAGAGQVLLIAWALRRAEFFPRFNRTWRDPRIAAVAGLMGPMMLGLSVMQINTFADFLIAYVFVRADGERVGPAVLGYAQYLYQLPLGVFGIAIATAIFPLLSERAAAGDRDGLGRLLERGLATSLFIALPAAVGLIFIARPLVAALYERGAFDPDATRRVSGTLVFYSLGLPAYFVQHLIVRTFYALHDSRTPARVATWMVVVNLALNLALVQVLEERGLALATAVCAVVQVVWLTIRLRSVVPGPMLRVRPLMRTAIATAVMAAALYALMSSGWHAYLESRSLRVLLLVVAGVLTYGAAALAMGGDELRALWHRGRGTAMRG